MSFNIKYSQHFRKSAKALAKKHPSFKSDLTKLVELFNRKLLLFFAQLLNSVSTSLLNTHKVRVISLIVNLEVVFQACAFYIVLPLPILKKLQ